MLAQLQKAINLSKKTGDKIIVVDSADPRNSFVVMSLDEYEKIVEERSGIKSLTEDELLDKINRDIAVCKNNDTNFFLNSLSSPKQAWSGEEDNFFNLANNNVAEADDDIYYYEDKSQEILDEYKDPVNKNSKDSWKIPFNIKKGAEEVK